MAKGLCGIGIFMDGVPSGVGLDRSLQLKVQVHPACHHVSLFNSLSKYPRSGEKVKWYVVAGRVIYAPE
jgi:hypothetical protein